MIAKRKRFAARVGQVLPISHGTGLVVCRELSWVYPQVNPLVGDADDRLAGNGEREPKDNLGRW